MPDITRPDGRVIRPNETLRLSFGVYPSCEGGDGYVVPEAREACANRLAAPPAVELLLKHITERLGGKVEPPPADRGRRIE